jgi:16S rRNA (cytosine1402-N4)-methyltransferase
MRHETRIKKRKSDNSCLRPQASSLKPEGMFHEPVLLPEALELLAVRPGQVVVDGTVGGGGHTQALCERVGPAGQVIGLDRDPEALVEASRRLADYRDRLVLIQENFARLGMVLDGLAVAKIDSVLLDLGPSLHQLKSAERGFGFGQTGPLDMRMNPADARGAKELLQELSLADLERLLRQAGEARFARPIARVVVRRREQGRPLETTTELARLVEEVVRRPASRRSELHPATKTFLALRLLVNRELESLEAGLSEILARLKPAGRVAVLSYHSLEDRLVKEFFQRESQGCLCPPEVLVCQCGHRPSLRILTRRPVRPRAEELARNPRSRSARLRAAEKLEGS